MFVSPEQKELQYTGRIDFDNPKAPELVFACTSIKLRFSGTSVKVRLRNHRNYWTNQMGYFIDGVQGRITLRDDDAEETYLLAEALPLGTHELLFFKRMDACHTVTFLGFELSEGAFVLPCEEKPKRRMEVFGDSVSCGEVSEAVEYAGKPDPEHDGQYSNSWYSYAWMTARTLNAQLHDTSQGGIALLDKTGWFAGPNFVGMESCYDKVRYNPQLGETKPWDFSRYVPQVVIVAIGQNDNHPVDYMAQEYDGEKAKYWRMRYRQFVERLLELYPGAQVILTTTILGHDAAWDKAIEDVCTQMNRKNVHHFLYSKNGCGTPGHIRIPEAEQMAAELSGFIRSLGEEIWQV